MPILFQNDKDDKSQFKLSDADRCSARLRMHEFGRTWRTHVNTS